MLSQMTSFFNSAFYFAGTNWKAILVAIALGLVFGAVWLAFYLPPLFKKRNALGRRGRQRNSHLVRHRFRANSAPELVRAGDINHFWGSD